MEARARDVRRAGLRHAGRQHRLRARADTGIRRGERRSRRCSRPACCTRASPPTAARGRAFAPDRAVRGAGPRAGGGRGRRVSSRSPRKPCSAWQLADVNLFLPARDATNLPMRVVMAIYVAGIIASLPLTFVPFAALFDGEGVRAARSPRRRARSRATCPRCALRGDFAVAAADRAGHDGRRTGAGAAVDGRRVLRGVEGHLRAGLAVAPQVRLAGRAHLESVAARVDVRVGRADVRRRARAAVRGGTMPTKRSTASGVALRQRLDAAVAPIAHPAARRRARTRPAPRRRGSPRPARARGSTQPLRPDVTAHACGRALIARCQRTARRPSCRR